MWRDIVDICARKELRNASTTLLAIFLPAIEWLFLANVLLLF